MSGILAEKCDIENANNPQTRETALANLQTIMFGDKNPIKKNLQDKNKKDPPPNILQSLPKKGTVNREWLDIATNKKDGPSNYPFDDPEPSRRGKQPQFGANPEYEVDSDPNNSIPHKSPSNNPDNPDIPDEQVIDEEYDDLIDFDGNNKKPKDLDSYSDDPDNKRRKRGKPRDIMLRYPDDDYRMLYSLQMTELVPNWWKMWN